MIRTSKNTIRKIVEQEYIRMLAESKALSEEELQELELFRRRKGGEMPPAKPQRVDVGSGVEVLDPEIADVEQELARAQWVTDEPEWDPSATQRMTRTVAIDPSEKRPYAKKAGLAEEGLKSIIAKMVRETLGK